MVPLPPAPRIPFRLVNLSVAQGRSRSRREDPARRRPCLWLTPLKADLFGVNEAALLETGLATLGLVKFDEEAGSKEARSDIVGSNIVDVEEDGRVPRRR